MVSNGRSSGSCPRTSTSRWETPRQSGFLRRYHPFFSGTGFPPGTEGSQVDGRVRPAGDRLGEQLSDRRAVHGAMATKAGQHPQTVLDEPHIRLAVASHVDVGDDVPGDAQVGQRRGADARELRELLEKLRVTIAGRVLLEEDGHN